MPLTRRCLTKNWLEDLLAELRTSIPGAAEQGLTALETKARTVLGAFGGPAPGGSTPPSSGPSRKDDFWK